MQGRKNYTEKLFTSFQLSDRIPKDNFYRKLKETLDFSFLYKDTKALYGSTGNPSIDPVVFFKLMLTGYLENITSDRKLVEHCAMRMDILYFLGYDIDEPLPWHSTVSRTRQLYPSDIFEVLFNKVFTMCVQKGMVSGHTQAVDSAPIKANASMENLELKRPAHSIENHFILVNAENKGEDKSTITSVPLITATEQKLRHLQKHQEKLRKKPSGPAGASHEKAQLFSNKTHYNPHDPDARISIKPGKARKLNYHCSMSVDTAQGVISHIQADFADSRDSRYLPGLVSSVQYRLMQNELRMSDLLADAGYSNGYNYKLLEQQDINAWIPVFGKYKPEVEGFSYNKVADQFTCPMGKPLPFKALEYNADGKPMKAYWASRKDCNSCVLKPECVGNRGCKTIVRSAYDPEYQRAHTKQQSRRGQQMKRLRQSTVEPVFGSLVQHYGLNKINVLGREGAHKNMLMAAVAFNIKKYLKTVDRKATKSDAVQAPSILNNGLMLL